MASVVTNATTDVAFRRTRSVAVVGGTAVVCALLLAVLMLPADRLGAWLLITGVVTASAAAGLALARSGYLPAGAWVLLIGCGVGLLLFPVQTGNLAMAPYVLSPWCAAALILLGRRALPLVVGAAVVQLVLMAMFAPPAGFVRPTFGQLLVGGAFVSLVTVGLVVYGIWEGGRAVDTAGEAAQRAQDELNERLQVNAELRHLVAERERALNDVGHDQEQLIVSLADTAVRDPRTGLLNGRHHKRHWLRAIADSRASGLPLAVIAFDLDYFGRINKDYSHQTGDVVLEEFAAMVRRLVRPGDLPYRLGQGEEFVVLLPHTRADEAMLVAERVRISCRKHVWPNLDAEHRLTVSAGVTQRDPESDDRWVDVLARADEALAQAKAEGRDRVIGASPKEATA